VTIGPSFIEGLDIHRKKSECSPPPKRVPRMRLRSPRHPRCDRWWDLSRTSLDWDSKRTPTCERHRHQRTLAGRALEAEPAGFRLEQLEMFSFCHDRAESLGINVHVASDSC
jgi:hypothetical protein